MNQVREEIRNYFTSPSNQGPLRRVACIRVSGKRLMMLACKYLPGSESMPPF